MSNKLWLRIKRNPVLLAALGTIAVQIVHDYQAGILTDDVNWVKYLATLGLGMLARQYTVPYKEFEAVRENFLELKKRGTIRD